VTGLLEGTTDILPGIQLRRNLGKGRGEADVVSSTCGDSADAEEIGFTSYTERKKKCGEPRWLRLGCSRLTVQN